MPSSKTPTLQKLAVDAGGAELLRIGPAVVTIGPCARVKILRS
jgi:hypothetical protein